MNKTNKLQEEKRAAYRRFSKIGAAGLAVISLSAFADVSAQPLPDVLKTDTVKEQQKNVIMPVDSSFVQDDDFRYFSDYGGHSEYSNSYCNYFNYSNYSNNNINYSNTYGDLNYSNNYSNYSNYYNYSNYK